MQPEGILARDVAAAGRDLLEQPHAALERAREAFLLRREDAVDFCAVVSELRVGRPDLLDHDVGEASEVRRLEPDA